MKLMQGRDESGKIVTVYVGQKAESREHGSCIILGRELRDYGRLLTYNESRAKRRNGHDGSASKTPCYVGVKPTHPWGYWWYDLDELTMDITPMPQGQGKCIKCFYSNTCEREIKEEKDKDICFSEYEKAEVSKGPEGLYVDDSKGILL